MFKSAISHDDDCGSGAVGGTHVSFGRGRYRDVNQTPQVGRAGTPRLSSTRIEPAPVSSNPLVTDSAELSTLIADLANKIGQSIAAELQSNVGARSQSSDSFHTVQNSTPSELNLSGVKLVMQSDIKEPPVFKGDGSDKCSVNEWIEMVELYLTKRQFQHNNKNQKF